MGQNRVSVSTRPLAVEFCRVQGTTGSNRVQPDVNPPVSRAVPRAAVRSGCRGTHLVQGRQALCMVAH